MTGRLTALMIAVAGGAAYAGAPDVVPAPPASAPRGPQAERAKPANEPPDAAVDEAAEANLESTAERRGLTFAASVGGGLTIGFGIAGSVGRGGAVSLRLGHVATRSTVITFEVSTSVALHEPHVMNPSVKTNTDTNLLAGAQYYLHHSLWVRVAAGVGIYRGEQVELSTGGIGDLQLVAPAVLGGVGVEFARFKWAVLGLETGTSAMVTRNGVLISSCLDLGLSFQ
jgi:hypothetical protein